MSQIAPSRHRNLRLALICAMTFAGMVGAAYASVPLYRAFCQATGFGGTTQRATGPAPSALDRTLEIRFDTNVRDLPWRFTADQASQTVKIGASNLAFFKVTNTGDKAVTGRAVYNVVPEQAGLYFQKLECFCFKSQTIQPGQTLDFPVVYFVDPGYVNDPETRDGPEITLSYTFYPAVNQGADKAVSKTADITLTHPAAVSAAGPLGGTPRRGL
jgi:cytochrome c oxidase assembly protein subunit 11